MVWQLRWRLRAAPRIPLCIFEEEMEEEEGVKAIIIEERHLQAHLRMAEASTRMMTAGIPHAAKMSVTWHRK